MSAWNVLRGWPARRWAAAGLTAVLTVLVVGVPTVLVPNPVFARAVPVTWWAWPALLVTSALSGLLLATYVRGPAVPSAAPSRAGVAGGFLTYLAVGCPVCNKLALLALGYAGAVRWFAPVQPLLAVAGAALLLYALRRRLLARSPARLRRRARRDHGAPSPMTSATARERHVVIGTAAEAARTCAALLDRGADVTHLGAPTDAELADVLRGDVTSMVVLLHDDTQALRYCLAAEHLRPGLPMVAALFDKTAASALVAVVPNCRVSSPADIAAPSLAAACLPGGAAGVCRTGEGWSVYPDGHSDATSYRLPAALRARSRVGILLGQLRPHDSGSTLLLSGLAGIALLLVVDTVLGFSVLHEPFIEALHGAVRTVATVGPVPVEHAPPGYLLFAAVAMLLTIGLTAAFTAGVVEHLLSGRLIGLVGRRVLPRRGHVVVVGMGRVGLRLAAELRELGIAVIGIDRDATAANLRTARALGIPVLIGDGARRRVLARVRADRALALCAVGSDELDNVAVAVTARAVAPDVPVVLRAGNHDVIAETRSLFKIGTVVDVTGLTSAYVVSCIGGERPIAVVTDERGTWVRSAQEAVLVPESASGCPHSRADADRAAVPQSYR